jgi:hypothetical protein
MRWFGPSWNAPVCELGKHAPTPTGEFCFLCQTPIEDGDTGFVLPCADATGVCSTSSCHRWCLLVHTTPTVIHRLRQGFADCRFTLEMPGAWPAWNIWTDRDREVTCENCRAVASSGAPRP